MSENRTGAQLLWHALLGEGVTTVFGYPGGVVLPAYDALLETPIRHVLVRHEQGAVHMADGFARASGRVGVALATSGPGATNMVTGMATAMLDSSPIVCITGQVTSAVLGTDAFQETDITGITMPITKHNYLVTEAGTILDSVHEAFFLARSGRPGPVHIDVTKDALVGHAAVREPRPPACHARHALPPLDHAALERATEMIRHAHQPVILAGHGATISGAEDTVRAIAERCQIPVAVTLLGLGAFPCDHPLYLGMMGMHGTAWANQSIQEADLLLAFGMRFDDRVTGRTAKFAPRAWRIHVDIDPSEIDKNVRADLALVGDLRQVLDALLPQLPPAEHRHWLDHVNARKHAARTHEILRRPASGPLRGPEVIDALRRTTGGNALIVADVGQNQMWTAQYYPPSGPRQLITSGGLGTMGFALPAAIGARLARPDGAVWAVAGDGGFQMTMAELATLQQEQLDVKIAILNNGYLGMVRQWQELFYDGRTETSRLSSPDFVRLAGAYGIPALRIEERAELDDALARAHATPGAVLVELRIAPEDCVYPMVAPNAELGTMLRRPIDAGNNGRKP
jgi:acetolactate synthase-1/2/3 large subunit